MNFKLFNDLIFVILDDIMNEALLHKNIHDSEVAIKAVFLLMEVVEVRCAKTDLNDSGPFGKALLQYTGTSGMHFFTGATLKVRTYSVRIKKYSNGQQKAKLHDFSLAFRPEHFQ